MKLHELLTETSVRKWTAEVRKQHGDVKIWNDTVHKRIIAKDADGNIKGSFDRKNQRGTVFESEDTGIVFDDDHIPTKPYKGSEWSATEDTSKILQQIKELLEQGNKVDWTVPGAMGHVVDVLENGVVMKRWNRPTSKRRYFLPLLNNKRDDKYSIIKKAPGYYRVVSAEEWT